MTDILPIVEGFFANNEPFGKAFAEWAMIPLNAQFAAAERELAEFKAIACGTALSPSAEPLRVSSLTRFDRYRKENTSGGL